MGTNRFGKNHSYDALLAAQGGYGSGAYHFDALYALQDKWVADVASSAGGTAILAQILIPQRSVLVKVSVYGTAVTSTTTSDVTLQMQVGPAASTSLTFTATGADTVDPQTVAVVGEFVWATAKQFGPAAGTTAPLVVSYIPDDPEGYYETGQELLLQIKTTNNGGVTNPIILSCLFATLDPTPWINTANPSTDF